ncbi:TetR/AcrR family transcriptional regulator [Actinoallomurus spadix]|uniref:TetR/AcrR family transcriptional regulator n=1 Tax=Actinoallomurus spadix TaxID=79912 RepID=A0ABP3G925_9ACTN|nr:TetR/AcrR family transcriptional regulator [Actinoallomurus spadix]MCO5990543.1 TetR/AcrR family transcriptional regulator [Actinoallomurus spadix]
MAWRIEEEPPPTSTRGRPLSAKGERTRRGLLDAAEQVFGALGYQDASIVKITEAAEVAQGTFYIYFESKRQIFDELVADLNRRVRRAMSEGSRQGHTRTEAERLGFLGFFRFTAEHPALYRIIRQAEFAAPDALRRHYQAIADGYVSGLRGAMDDGEIAAADPEVVAWALMGVGEMIGMRWILWRDDAEAGEVPEHVFEEMYAFVRRGLGAR